jgi:PleD family two-component response regulator
VTKCVSDGTRNNPTHIPRNGPDTLIYSRPMPSEPHILIVDDHREIRDLVSRALIKEGFRVSTAADGRSVSARSRSGALAASGSQPLGDLTNALAFLL